MLGYFIFKKPYFLKIKKNDRKSLSKIECFPFNKWIVKFLILVDTCLDIQPPT